MHHDRRRLSARRHRGGLRVRRRPTQGRRDARRGGAGAAEQHARPGPRAAATRRSSVEMGPVLDGVVGAHGGLPDGARRSWWRSGAPVDVAEVLRRQRCGGARQLPAGRQPAGHRALRARLPRSRRGLRQLHPGVHRVRSAVGRASSSAAASRSSATTSSRSSARPSCTARWRSCSPTAASRSTAPTS